ncbi:hypothetical protein [Aurantimonas marina]|uniref:hypothetical protein n=1 Tax=Aurantimonas marina TaxID=2780508 RepID=UPI0019D0C16C|nr:hypothetical protein [Aurantimonas marina]
MRKHYEPPRQSGLGQFLDSIFLLALVYVALFIPLILGLTGAGSTTVTPAEITWETLEQNVVMQAQWEKLGYTPETAAEMITTRFDYTIDPLMLLLTAAVILGYFVYLIRMSDKEYRDVISEKFDL